MDNFTAIEIALGLFESSPTEEEYLQAWQHLVDTGLAWTLEGHIGRTAQGLIRNGDITPDIKTGV